MDKLDSFQLFLVHKNISYLVIKQHLWRVKKILAFCGDLTKDKFDAFVWDLLAQGKAKSYVNQFINTVCRYAEFAGVDELKKYKRLKPDEAMKDTLSDQEIEALLSLPTQKYKVVSKTGKSFYRSTRGNHDSIYTMFWKICAFTGMRMGEAAGLSVDRVDFGKKAFLLDKTKTGHPRYVPIPVNIEDEVKEYVSKLKGEYLFPAERGGSGHDPYKRPVIKIVDWNYDFKKRVKRLGIKRRGLTPYSLRHSMITRLLEENVNLFKVQKLVGHKRIETTARYTHLTTKDIQETLKKHPLIRKSTDPQFILQSFIDAIKAFGLGEDGRFKFSFNQTERSLSLNVEIA